MKHKLTQLIAALDRLVNYFTPPGIMADPGSLQGRPCFPD